MIHVSATFVKEIDRAQGLDAGADGYITHPVEPPVLIATAKAFLRARKAEDRLRESDARFKAVFENALGGILMLDHDLAIVEVNPAMCRMLGRTREAIIGQTLASFLDSGTEDKPADIAANWHSNTLGRGRFHWSAPTAAVFIATGTSPHVRSPASPSPPTSPSASRWKSNARNCWPANAPPAPKPRKPIASRTSFSATFHTNCEPRSIQSCCGRRLTAQSR